MLPVKEFFCYGEKRVLSPRNCRSTNFEALLFDGAGHVTGLRKEKSLTFHGCPALFVGAHRQAERYAQPLVHSISGWTKTAVRISGPFRRWPLCL